MILKKESKQAIVIASILLAMSGVVFIAYPYARNIRDYFKTYSHSSDPGKEVMYSYIEEGDIHAADMALDGVYEISRFDPVTIDEIRWDENPYDDIYWRFNFYNLEPVRNLLYAWRATGDDRYLNGLMRITESFLDNGMDGEYSWDLHGTAFRVMTLIDVRAKLKAGGVLSDEFDYKITEALETHGKFLADPEHFEKDYNHGLDQSAALFLLSVNYPDFPESSEWRELGAERMTEMVEGIVDSDGILVENSPYYHLYVLEKYYEINDYLTHNGYSIDGFSDEKIRKMAAYVVYMLQPDATVPTVGASITRRVDLNGIYKTLAASDPELLYVLTKGMYGREPLRLNINYPTAGQTIMRSGWGRGKDFENQTQLIFDIGNYRTDHSDLDALSFNLFARGIAMMPDAGLYSYEDGPYRDYFHGTRAHNTVVVDGNDQDVGDPSVSEKVTAGFFEEGDGYSYQSGRSDLYAGVSHERAIALIGDSTFVIVDDLHSDEEHTYEQMFHLFPGAEISESGLALTATGREKDQKVRIRQLGEQDGTTLRTALDDRDAPDGLCSIEYNSALPCHAVSYSRTGKDASFVTVIDIGGDTSDAWYDRDAGTVTVQRDGKEYRLDVSKADHQERRVDVDKKQNIDDIYSVGEPEKQLNTSYGWDVIDVKDVEQAERYVDRSGKDGVIAFSSPTDGSLLSVGKDFHADFSKKNIFFQVKIEGSRNIEGIDVSLSNDGWEKEATFNIEKIGNYLYEDREGDWLRFGVSKGEDRHGRQGSWVLTDPSFDWRRVDGIKFYVQTKPGTQATVSAKDFMLVPDSDEARLLIIFDDGWSSVTKAADIMAEHDMKGSVGVITRSVGKKSYLTLEEVKRLHDLYGWDIVNHSSLHKTAVEEYGKTGDLEGLETDVLDALQYLIENDINTAPNWYIYPDGSTDGTIESVIGKYYKFARATATKPELYPFPEPLEVGVFSAYSDRATAEDVHYAVSDAIKYKQMLVLMFHKLSDGESTVFTEYPVDTFRTMIEDIDEQGIKVVTLSELDAENGIPETEFTLHKAVPEQIHLDVTVRDIPPDWISDIVGVWNRFFATR